ncbi:hypothetical protein NEDG_01338 [Nematocida displodere]|uniref:Uncharacterized protein n=1 Tax=Nematocida displodere TaxID=1805483 RepID=A0A177EBE9_9MICR|nr:hypothetical protein NEDG_01338 [Nematocida displodere]
MDAQERAALISARLKASTYLGDKLDAVKEADKLASENTLIAGTYLLTALLEVSKDPELFGNSDLFAALNKILTGASGNEFIDIIFKQEDVPSLVVFYLLQKQTDSCPELAQTLEVLARARGAELARSVAASEDLVELLGGASEGRGVLIRVLKTLARTSPSLNKLLIFNGFLEGMMNLSLKAKTREGSREALTALFEAMINGAEGVQYFLELPWRAWLGKVLSLHPHYATRLIQGLASHSRHRKRVAPLLGVVVDLQDLFSIYLLSIREPGPCFEVSEGGLAEKLAAIVEQAKTASCFTKLNTIMGIEYNISQSTETKRGSVGDISFLGRVCQKPVEISEDDVFLLVYDLTKLPQMSLPHSVLFVKTALLLVLHNGSPALLSPEVLQEVRELLETERPSLYVKAACGVWLLKAFLEAAPEEKDLGAFRDLEEKILPQVQHFATALVAPVPTPCLAKGCKRCYLSEVLASSPLLPEPCQTISHPLWLPPFAAALVLSVYTTYLGTISAQIPSFVRVPNTPTIPTPGHNTTTPNHNTKPAPNTTTQNNVFDL